MTKQWSLKSVFDKHNYSTISKVDTHSNFAQWLVKQFGDSKISVVDIGGGNGRVVLSVYQNLASYTCLDLNQWNIEIGSDYFHSDDKIRFILFDIEKERWLSKCDLVYIDSVLTMLEEPFKVLDEVMLLTDYIFVNRTRLTNNTVKDSYVWSGMQKPSTLWSFGKSTLEKFCEDRDFTMQVVDDVSFVIKKHLV